MGMDARRIERIEQSLDVVAAAAFAAAVAFAALRFGAVAAAVAGAASFAAVFRILGVIGATAPAFPIEFEAPELPAAIEPEEMLLTDVYRPEDEEDELVLDNILPAPDAVLVLEDVLARLSEDSRVIRLFDPAAMPTPGEMKSRVDRHLQDSPVRTADASEELHTALADLRKSLR
jgi:hypothetical protein